MSSTGARPLAVLAGTERQPEMRLTFDRSARHAVSGENLTDWVKKAPRRHWDREATQWVITAFGGRDGNPKSPERVLRKAGFDVLVDHPDLDESLKSVLSLEDLVDPVCRQSKKKPTTALVRPRFAGWDVCREILGQAAIWDKESQRFEVPLTELLKHGNPKAHLVIDDTTIEAARAALLRKPTFGSDKHDDETLTRDAAALAYSTGLDLTDAHTEQIDRLVEVVGDVPDWFGLDLYPYQRLGAIASLAGRNVIADPTGLGKGSPDSVRILTPTGWTTYGEIGVGDRVVGSDGKPATVIGVYPRGELDVYKVTFSDRSSVVVDGDHLWSVDQGGQWATVETRSLAPGYRIPLVAPVRFDPHPQDPGPSAAGLAGQNLDHASDRVPTEILLGSIETRNAYLDGARASLLLARRNGVDVFRARSALLREGLTFLIQSLGGTAHASLDAADILPMLPGAGPDTQRLVLSVEPVGRENVTCIAVDAADALYVTEDFIVTHNTRQALAALAILDVDRAVIVVPPVVLTNWAREAEESRLAAPKPKPLTKAEIKRREKAAKALQEGGGKSKAAPLATASEREAAFNEVSNHGLVDPLAPPSTASHGRPDQTSLDENYNNCPTSTTGSPRFLTVIRAGRKEPEFPERGIIIVPDSLLASRKELRNKIAAWAPTALIYDEAHRARTWSSARAKAMREMCDMLPPDALRLPMTATPLFSNPAELASLLALSGHLDPVFGGYTAFVERYCKRNHFNALVANKKMLPELRQILAERVWVRRRKSEVLKDLPKVSLRAKFVDVDLAGFRAAHDEVIEKIGDWLTFWVESEGDYPNDDDIKTFSRTSIGLMSPLRRAAGMAKVPVALDTISDWIADEVEVGADGSLTCERPLIIWAHHHEIVDALVEHAGGHLKDSDRRMVGVIAGSTTAQQVGHYVDEFQAGRLPILVLSITKAGVGITLTRGSDQIFMESSYSVPEVSQAIDRQNRIGQTNPIMVTTLIAEGTLDARIQKILNSKSEIINAVLGDDAADISVISDDDLDDKMAPAEIIESLVHLALDKHRRENTKQAA